MQTIEQQFLIYDNLQFSLGTLGPGARKGQFNPAFATNFRTARGMLSVF